MAKGGIRGKIGATERQGIETHDQQFGGRSYGRAGKIIPVGSDLGGGNRMTVIDPGRTAANEESDTAKRKPWSAPRVITSECFSGTDKITLPNEITTIIAPPGGPIS
jgi:hypothetical protein